MMLELTSALSASTALFWTKINRIVLETPYLRHFGLIYEETHTLLDNIIRTDRLENTRHDQIGQFYRGSRGTSGGKTGRALTKWRPSHRWRGPSTSRRGFVPSLRWGARTRRFFSWRTTGTNGGWSPFNMNGPCASGTGSFIDQQAERLAQSIYGADFSMDQDKLQQTLDDFIDLGLKSTYPAPVACRCTVFTKSDMIHLQNKGESLPNIIAGLHFGNAANYVSTIVGKPGAAGPDYFHRRHGFQPAPGEGFPALFSFFEVPAYHTSIGALGVAVQAAKANVAKRSRPLRRFYTPSLKPVDSFPRAERLELSLSRLRPGQWSAPWARKKGKPVEAYLGVDIGSTTTKYALISEKAQILHKCYVPTQGKPIEVTQRLLRTLQDEVGGKDQAHGDRHDGIGPQCGGGFSRART